MKQDHWHTAQTKSLFSAILRLQNQDECKRFFRDLMTVNELKEITDRWEAVQLIDQEVPYRTIAEKTSMSTATVSRIAHWLHHGRGGYRLILDRMNKRKKK